MSDSVDPPVKRLAKRALWLEQELNKSREAAYASFLQAALRQIRDAKELYSDHARIEITTAEVMARIFADLLAAGFDVRWGEVPGGSSYSIDRVTQTLVRKETTEWLDVYFGSGPAAEA